MNVTIVCVGRLKEKYWTDAVNEYSKRLSRYVNLKITELPDEKAPENLSEAQKKQVIEKNTDLKYEKNKGIDGHHKESVLLHPDKMTDPRNIKFMNKKDHIKYHQKNEIE